MVELGVLHVIVSAADIAKVSDGGNMTGLEALGNMTNGGLELTCDGAYPARTAIDLRVHDALIVTIPPFDTSVLVMSGVDPSRV